MEDSFSRLEKTRFELSTKNASLQEKVVMLQTDVADRKRREQELLQEKEEKEETSSRYAFCDTPFNDDKRCLNTIIQYNNAPPVRF